MQSTDIQYYDDSDHYFLSMRVYKTDVLYIYRWLFFYTSKKKRYVLDEKSKQTTQLFICISKNLFPQQRKVNFHETCYLYLSSDIECLCQTIWSRPFALYTYNIHVIIQADYIDID